MAAPVYCAVYSPDGKTDGADPLERLAGELAKLSPEDRVKLLGMLGGCAERPEGEGA